MKTVKLNSYADDGQLYSLDLSPAALDERIVREVEIANNYAMK